MSPSIKSLIADTSIAAITLRQALEPIEGRDVPIFPPTYPPSRERKSHRFDTPYTINETAAGTRVCDLDSVQSQANRMEAAFTAPTGPLADLVPHHIVSAPNRLDPSARADNQRVDLTALPHRIADASIRATRFSKHIRSCFEAIESGNPVPLARIAPTSLVYGAWDSRDTHVRLPRAVRSEIRAHDVSIFTRSAQYSGAFEQDVLGLNDQEWKKGADVGFAPTPSVDQPGGILARGEIVQSASILLNVLRKYRTADATDSLPAYLLGLALGGLLTTGREYLLRSGCALVPAAPEAWQSVSTTGQRELIRIDAEAIVDEIRALAGRWAETAGVELGGEPTVHELDATIAKSMVKSASRDAR